MENTQKRIKIGILGANGYTGFELVRILSRHKFAKIVYLGSRSFKGKNYAEIYPHFEGLSLPKCDDLALCEVANECDCVFTATPQGFCMSEISENVLEKCKIIDLSADFRLKDAKIYEKWYKIPHTKPEFLGEAVYGLCEIYREKIKNARLIANPGCYTTCAILSLYPLLNAGIIDTQSIIIDAKSGKSGAGRGEKLENLFCETNENFAIYGVKNHRHTPEIDQELSFAAKKALKVQFTPHLVPMQRGILSTIYANLMQDLSEDELREILAKFYAKEPFIRLLPKGVCPQTKFARGTNLVFITVFKDERTKRLIIASALDNLTKGAAGQAVQNMNLLFGFDEIEALSDLAIV